MNHSDIPVKPTIKCAFGDCTAAFHKKDAYRIHIARSHIKEMLKPWIIKKDDSKIHSCDVCKAEYNSYPAILYHVMDHAKETTDLALRAKLLSI